MSSTMDEVQLEELRRGFVRIENLVIEHEDVRLSINKRLEQLDRLDGEIFELVQEIRHALKT